MASELDVVDVFVVTDLEHGNQFVLRPIEAALTAVVLCPDADVLQARIDGLARFDQFADVAPVHATRNGARRRERHSWLHQEPAEESR